MLKSYLLLMALAGGPLPGCKDNRTSPKPVVVVDVETLAELARVARYETCWGYFNDSKWKALETCYAPDAEIQTGLASPDAVLETGHAAPELVDVATHLDGARRARTAFPSARGDVELAIGFNEWVIALVRMTGHSRGDDSAKTPYYLAEVVKYDERGRVTREEIYRDSLTASRRLPAEFIGNNRVVVFEEKESELRNHDVVEKLVDGLESPAGPESVKDLLSTDFVYSERWLARDLDKRELVDFMREISETFDNSYDFGPPSMFAGDYVVASEVVSARPGTRPWLGVTYDPSKLVLVPRLTIFRVDRGKVKAAVSFFGIDAMYEQLGIDPPATAPMPPLTGRADDRSSRD